MVAGAPKNVLDYGADVTGTTDSASAFNAALSAAGAQAVYVPAGTYKIIGTVTGKFFSYGGVTITTGTVASITNLVP